MRTHTLALLCLLLLGPALRSQGLESRTLLVDGRQRSYYVHLPAGHQPGVPLPVVFGLHGGGGNAASFESYGWNATSDANGFLMVYPEGVGPAQLSALKTWNAGNCCGMAATENVDDVHFISELIDAVNAEWPIDLNRVYATGFSNGGMMSYRLGLELADRLAAIAPVGAALGVTTIPSRPIPLLAIHGALDENVPWEGGVGIGVSGVSLTSQEDSIAPFAQINGTGAFPGQLEQIVGQAVLYTSDAPLTGAPIHYWWLWDQGHTWPGTPAILNPSQPYNQDIDANQLIWDFFAAHPRERLVSVTAPGCGLSGEPAPTLDAGLPLLGSTLELEISGAPLLLGGQLWISTPPAAPLVLPSGCVIGVDPQDALQLAPLGPGSSQLLPIAIPAEPSLHRFEISLQGLWWSLGGLRASNALTLRLAW